MSPDSPGSPAVPPHGGAQRSKSERPGGPQSLVGKVLGQRYLMERLLGEGGMGAVYQAQHTHMRKRLAVKVLHPEMSRLPEVVARFEREAMVAAHIEHPNVAAATDFGKLEDGSFFLVLEYVEGKSLRSVLSRGRMELGRALHIVRQIASGLARAHALGIVHRDLKPDNVMLVTREGDPDFVKVLDFGIAKVPVGEFVARSSGPVAISPGGSRDAPPPVLTQVGMVYGTPEYMAPEQALGHEVDARADLYALGVMAFEMITGVRPFEHESKVVLLGMHVTAAVPTMNDRAPDAGVPREIEAIVARLLAKDANERFRDARQLIEELDACAADLAAQGRITDVPAAPSLQQVAVADAPTVPAFPQGGTPWMTSRRALGFTIGAFAILALVVTAFFVAGASGDGRAAAGATGVAGAGGSLFTSRSSTPDPTTSEVIAAARSKIEKGDFASAIEELLPIEKREPDRPDGHALLERAYTAVHNAHDAMREAGLWLAADPGASTNLKLEEDVRNAALMHDAPDDAFALLQSKMGERGVDLLYDIAFGSSGRLYPQAAARAKRSLELDDVRKRASPALAVALAFRDAKTCELKRALLADIRDKGDSRILALLQPYESTRGCGFLGHADCYPCLHRDRDLADALQALQDRRSKPQ